MKYKAFTVAELVVALAITSTVITIGYLSLYALKNTTNSLVANADQAEMLQQMRYLIKQDFTLTHDWEITSNQMISRSDSIVYTFEETTISRIQRSQTDRFVFNAVNLTALEEGRYGVEVKVEDLLFKLNIQFERGSSYGIALE